MKPGIDGLCFPGETRGRNVLNDKGERKDKNTYMPSRSANSVRFSKGGCSLLPKRSFKAASCAGECLCLGLRFCWAGCVEREF